VPDFTVQLTLDVFIDRNESAYGRHGASVAVSLWQSMLRRSWIAESLFLDFCRRRPQQSNPGRLPNCATHN
jgi:hypothetical protein